MLGTSPPCPTTTAQGNAMEQLLAHRCLRHVMARIPDLPNHLASAPPGGESRPGEGSWKEQGLVQEQFSSRHISALFLAHVWAPWSPGLSWTACLPSQQEVLTATCCLPSPYTPPSLLSLLQDSQGPRPSFLAFFPRPHPSPGMTLPISPLCTPFF